MIIYIAGPMSDQPKTLEEALAYATKIWPDTTVE